MSDFGDATPDDSYDPTAPADPEAVGRILLELLRARVPSRTGSGPAFRRWDDHTPAEQAGWRSALAELLGRLRREGGLR